MQTDDERQQKARENIERLQAKYAPEIKRVQDMPQISATAIVYESGKGTYNLAVTIFLSAFFGLIGGGVLMILLSFIPLVGKFILNITPGWLLWVLCAGAWFWLSKLAADNCMLKLDEEGLSCWIGSQWKLVRWDSISKIHYENIRSTRGPTQEILTISHGTETFKYTISLIDKSPEVISLLSRKLGDRFSSNYQ